MIFEYATGADSFTERPGYKARNVNLTAYVYNTKSGLFENPRSLSNNGDVCKVTKVHKAIPATTVLATSAGNWYYYRAEALAGSLWLLTYATREGGPFEFEYEHLLVRAYTDAPLRRSVLTLPQHPFANVASLDFMWNADFVKSHDRLTKNELLAFKKLMGEASNEVVEVTQDDSELPSWTFQTIEKSAPVTKKIIRRPNKPTEITRVKRLRL